MELPSIALWDITSKCNLNCIHCYNSDNLNKEDKKPLIVLKELIQLGVKHIHLLGGEPLLISDLEEILKESYINNLKVTINTNGTLITSKISKLLLKYKINQLSISLDGGLPKTNDFIRGSGTFNKVLNNIDILNKEIEKTNIQIIKNLAFVLTEKNYKDFKNLIEICKKYNFNNLLVSQFYPSGKGIDNLGTFQEELKLNCLIDLVKLTKLHKINLILDTNNRVLNYLNIISNINCFPIERQKCGALKKNFYVNSQGIFYPCAPCTTQLGKDLNNGGNIDFKEKIMKKEIIKSKFCKECYFIGTCKICYLKKQKNPDSICHLISELELRFINQFLLNKKIDNLKYLQFFENKIYNLKTNLFINVSHDEKKIIEKLMKNKIFKLKGINKTLMFNVFHKLSLIFY